MAGDRQVIFKNEASRINEASKMLYKNEVTAVEAHYVYKILRTVIAYAESSVDPMNNDGIYFPKRKPADFTEILRSLYLWYNNVSEAVENGSYGNFLFSLPFSFNYLSTKHALAVFDEDDISGLVESINGLGKLMQLIFRRLPENYKIRRTKARDVNFDELPECSLALKNDMLELNFPVAPLLGLDKGGKLPDLVSGCIPVGRYEANKIKELTKKDDITEKEADEIFLLFLFSKAVKGKNKNTVDELEKWYSCVFDKIKSGSTGNFITTIPIGDVNLHFNKLIRKTRNNIGKENLINEMEIHNMRVNDFPPGVNADIYGKRIRMSAERAGMLSRLCKDFVQTKEILRIPYFKRDCTHDEVVAGAKFLIIKEFKIPLVITQSTGAPESFYLLRKDRERFGKYLLIPGKKVEHFNDIQDYISAIKYIADIEEEKKKEQDYDCWLEVER